MIELRNTDEARAWERIYEARIRTDQAPTAAGEFADGYIFEWRKRIDAGDPPSRSDLVQGLEVAGEVILELCSELDRRNIIDAKRNQIGDRVVATATAPTIAKILVFCAIVQGKGPTPAEDIGQ